MILVLGPNLAVDRVLAVPGFEAGRVFRTGQTRVVAGGKGANVARALKALGGQPHLVGLVAGWTGSFIRESLRQEGIVATAVEVEGLSRTCTLLVDPDTGQATVVNEEGELAISPARMALLEETLDPLISRARVVVCSGSLPPALPPDFYARIIDRARRHGALTVLDTSARALREGITARPHLIKPNRTELVQLLRGLDPRYDSLDPGREPALDTGPAGGEAVLAEAARALVSRGIEAVVVSMGAAGALAVTSDGAWLARAPAVRVVNPIGAGDSMVAALAEGLASGQPLPEILRRAVAAGSADVTTFGPGVIDREEVERLAAAVEPMPLAASGGHLA